VKFLFSFTLLVLPLFLLVCIQIIRQNEDFKRTVFGKFLIGLFGLFALASLGTAVYLITQL
jgi:hypothetical protein